MSVQAYPLSWPAGFPRTQRRLPDQFKSSLSAALNNVQKSLAAFGKDSGKKVESVCLSSNVTLGQQRPADPGVAVWFGWDGLQVCIPVDRYERVEANLQAIHHILESRRTELRHGGITIVRAAFTGLKALPPPSSGRERGWREVLGIPESDARLTTADEAWKKLRSKYHPDKNGGAEMPEFIEAKAAYDQACRELGNPG